LDSLAPNSKWWGRSCEFETLGSGGLGQPGAAWGALRRPGMEAPGVRWPGTARGGLGRPPGGWAAWGTLWRAAAPGCRATPGRLVAAWGIRSRDPYNNQMRERLEASCHFGSSTGVHLVSVLREMSGSHRLSSLCPVLLGVGQYPLSPLVGLRC